MTFLKAYAGTLVSFLVVDAVWIALVVRSFYRKEVGHLLSDTPNMAAAGIFYLAYAAGVVVLAVQPAMTAGTVKIALVHGAIIGGIAYGTYTVTNYAVMKGWTMGLVLSDIAWGMFLTALAAGCGYLAARL